MKARKTKYKTTNIIRFVLISFIVIIPFVLTANNNNDSNKEGYATLSGYVRDDKGEDLIGANVFVKNENLGTVSNVYGFYSLTLPKGNYVIIFSFVGYDPIEQNVSLDDNKTKNINLLSNSKNIDEVSISAVRKDVNVTDVAMSNVKLQTKQIKKIPVLFGETDVIKTVQLLPGVQTYGEGNSGFFVRGGSVDQNLILIDDATVYNPSHIGGIFSVFNGDALKGIELYKGGIPSSYGGRLSSVLDVRMKEGNKSKVSAYGGVGAISSRLTVEGPIIKNKSSFILSGRRTYADLFFPFSKNEGLKNSRLYFYDLNGKINYVVNSNNRIFISAYTGRDKAEFSDLFTMSFGNITLSTRWNHIYSPRIFSNLTLIYSNFDYQLGQPSGAFNFEWNANVIDQSIKNDYTYYINPNNTLRFGFTSIYHTIKPGNGEAGSESNLNIQNLKNSYAIENGIFLENEQSISEKLTVRYGLRYGFMYNIGKATIYSFVEDSEGESVVDDSTFYNNGEYFNFQEGWEPRISARYIINSKNSVKASYDRTYQYIHLATNTASVTPVDVWFLSNPNYKPQYADQAAVGYFRNFLDNSVETSVELYYKKMYRTIDFVDHAELLLNKYFDGEIRSGSAYSYGAEFFIRKQRGDFTGWISYTYSITKRKIAGINDDEEYFAPYDKPHDLKIVANYDISKRITVAANWVYSSPLAYTVAVDGYQYGNLWAPRYSSRNSVRLKGTDYHRLDLSVTINFLRNPKYENSLQVSIYNAYNRHNIYSILYEQPKDGSNTPVMKKFYLFGAIPTITYNFKF